MSMYHGIFVYPTEPAEVPSVETVLGFVQWLAEIGEIKSPDTEYPITVYFEEPSPEDNEENDPGEDVKFAAIDDQLRKILSNWSQWTISLWGQNLTNKGPFSRCFEIDGRKIDWSLIKSLFTPAEEQDLNSIFALDSICICYGDLRDYFGDSTSDDSFPVRQFAIKMGSEMKLAHPIEDPADFFNIVWPRLVASGVIAEMEKVLGIKLEASPYFG